MKIVESSTLRLCDVSKSNDFYEIRWLMDGFIREIKRYKKNIESSSDEDLSFINDFIMEVIMQKFEFARIEYSGAYAKEIYHVGCFSEEKDLLSQWAMYADDGHGISLGFCYDYLKLIKHKSSDVVCNLVKADYSTQNYDKMNKKLCTDFFRSINRKLECATKKSIPDYELSKLVESIMDEVFSLSIKHKNPSFEQEKEWRVYARRTIQRIHKENPVIISGENSNLSCRSNININDYFTLKNPDFIAKNNHLVSFTDLYLTDKSFIKHVIIGPKSKVRAHDIRDFLIAKGYPVYDIALDHSFIRHN